MVSGSCHLGEHAFISSFCVCVRKLNCISIKIILKELILGTYLAENTARLANNSNAITYGEDVLATQHE